MQLEGLDPEPYDYLIIGCGVTANYFGIDGAQEHALTIYTRSGAIKTRDRILTAIEDAAQDRDGAPDPTVVVVGGGATGVEMAGSLAELRNAAVPIAYRTLDISRVHIVLVEMMDVVLGPFHPKLQAYAAKELRERGVDLRLGTSVQQVREDAVVVKGPDGEEQTIAAAAVVWATGITAAPIVGDWGLPTGRGGRIDVGPDLRVTGHPEIFAVGDVALDPENLPQVAQPAIQGGKHAGRADPADAGGLAHRDVPLPRQGEHGHDRAQRRRRGVPVRAAAQGARRLAGVAGPAPVRAHGRPQPAGCAHQPVGAVLQLAAQPQHRRRRPRRLTPPPPWPRL